MPESRNRPGHNFQKPADIPASQRTKGTTVTSILFAAFGLIMAYFSAGANYIVLAIGAIVGGVIGYFVGKAMQKGAKKS